MGSVDDPSTTRGNIGASWLFPGRLAALRTSRFEKPGGVFGLVKSRPEVGGLDLNRSGNDSYGTAVPSSRSLLL